MSELLLYLASLDPSRVYDEDTGVGDAYLATLLEKWAANGYPGVEQGTPIPEGYADLCMIEVRPPYRAARGRFWLPKGHGYTNDPRVAGLFTVDEVGTDRGVAILPVEVAGE